MRALLRMIQSTTGIHPSVAVCDNQLYAPISNHSQMGFYMLVFTSNISSSCEYPFSSHLWLPQYLVAYIFPGNVKDDII